MRKIISIIHYEYKMQFGQPAAWGVLLAATLLSMLDNFPSAENLARLEFLNEPAYFVYRIMSLDTLVFLFGFMFLLGGRFPLDGKTEMKFLLMSTPLRKWQYVTGKLCGGNPSAGLSHSTDKSNFNFRLSCQPVCQLLFDCFTGNHGHSPVLYPCGCLLWLQCHLCWFGRHCSVLPDYFRRSDPADMGTSKMAFSSSGKRSGKWSFSYRQRSSCRKPAVFEAQLLEVGMNKKIESEIKVIGINFFILSALKFFSRFLQRLP